ncbi:hypothetical protein SGRIM128S_02760 [Streptomyces griseomycini]
MPYPATATPRVSSRCNVAATSRIDFTPAHTTVIRVRASSPRSADSSWVTVHSRCTPPSPPVANTRTPASDASRAVPDTVVAPLSPPATASGRSRWPSLRMPSPPATRSSCSLSRPTRGRPSSTATVAGTAPSRRTAASSSSATWRLRGRGSPCAMIVDSRATTGRFAAIASRTSSDTVSTTRLPPVSRSPLISGGPRAGPNPLPAVAGIAEAGAHD